MTLKCPLPACLPPAGKNVVLVDDSIVRGTTMSQIVEMVRRAGAKKVYLACASPPVIFPNVYGVDMPTRKEFVANGLTTEQVGVCGGQRRAGVCVWRVGGGVRSDSVLVRRGGGGGGAQRSTGVCGWVCVWGVRSRCALRCVLCGQVCAHVCVCA